jgi:hypothetical protein
MLGSLCCLGQTCSTIECCCQNCCTPAVKKYFHFSMYALFLVVSFALGYICLNDQIAERLPRIPSILDSCRDGEAVFCYGAATVYRIGLALTAFFLLHLGLSLTGRGYLHAYWLRWLLFAGGLVSTFFLPGELFRAYAWISLFLGGLYLLMLLVILIDFAHRWQESWIERQEERWFRLMVTCTFLFTTGAIALTALGYAWYSRPVARVALTVNLGLGLLTYLLPLKFERATLLPISIVVLYSTYLVFQGLQSGGYHHRSTWPNTVISTLMVLASLVWSIFSLTNSHTSFLGATTETEDHYVLPLEEEDQVTGGQEPPPDQHRPYRFFFFIMVLASGYMVAVLSSWHVYGQSIGSAVDSGTTSMYIKLSVSWLSYVLFIWTVVVPKMCPDRDFD